MKDDTRKSEVMNDSRVATSAPRVDKKHVPEIRVARESAVFAWSSIVVGGILGGTIAVTGVLVLLAVMELGAVVPH